MLVWATFFLIAEQTPELQGFAQNRNIARSALQTSNSPSTFLPPSTKWNAAH
jgi:hypothetical protein